MIAIDVPKEQLRDFCRRWKVTEFSLFGSVTRPDEFRPDSDVDVMVEFAQDAQWTLFDLVDMRAQLIEVFGRDVDLLTRFGVEHMRNYLRRDAILGTAVLLDVA